MAKGGVENMGLMDNLNAAVGGHEDQVKDGIDKLGGLLDDKVGGQYAGQVDNSNATSEA
jgi:MT0933-like antitoxin protein